MGWTNCAFPVSAPTWYASTSYRMSARISPRSARRLALPSSANCSTERSQPPVASWPLSCLMLRRLTPGLGCLTPHGLRCPPGKTGFSPRSTWSLSTVWSWSSGLHVTSRSDPACLPEPSTLPVAPPDQQPRLSRSIPRLASRSRRFVTARFATGWRIMSTLSSLSCGRVISSSSTAVTAPFRAAMSRVSLSMYYRAYRLVSSCIFTTSTCPTITPRAHGIGFGPNNTCSPPGFWAGHVASKSSYLAPNFAGIPRRWNCFVACLLSPKFRSPSRRPRSG